MNGLNPTQHLSSKHMSVVRFAFGQAIDLSPSSVVIYYLILYNLLDYFLSLSPTGVVVASLTTVILVLMMFMILVLLILLWR